MIKGILIDFGGTIDSDGIHWFDQFRDAYALVASVPESLLWDAYVHTERTLGRNPIIKPTDTFCKTLQTKIALQTEYLQLHGITVTAQDTILDTCYYGNMHTVLEEFGLSHLFKDVIESAVAGVRKPDPQIFRLGVEALGLEPAETVMIGDSPDKDILPAQSIGCQTILLQGKSRSEVQCTPDHTVSTLQEITF